MRLFISATLLILCSVSFALDGIDSSKQCHAFNNVALQLALAQPNMQSPLNLSQVQAALGKGKMGKTIVVATHTWVYKNRILLVKAINDDLTTKMLTGDDDGSQTSKKMEQIYRKLQMATSIWIIKEIQQQLGIGRVTRNKSQTYSWSCGIGSLEVITEQDGNFVAATIGYESHQGSEAIEAQFSYHPKWDIQTDSVNSSYRAWKRTF